MNGDSAEFEYSDHDVGILDRNILQITRLD